MNSGCAAWSYDNIELGQTPGEYTRALPETRRVQTELGLCSLDRRENMRLWGSEPRNERTEAIVLLLTPDRRVAGKFRAINQESAGGLLSFGSGDYRLTGELNPDMYGTSGAGTTDTIRALIGDLTDTVQPKVAKEAQWLVAAGLVRLIWPDAEDPGVSDGKLRSLLKRVPDGGTQFAEFGDDGVFRVEYSAESVPLTAE